MLTGAGRTEFERRRADEPARPDGGTIAWGAGDFVVLPAGCTCRHTADRRRRAPSSTG